VKSAISKISQVCKTRNMGSSPIATRYRTVGSIRKKSSPEILR